MHYCKLLMLGVTMSLLSPVFPNADQPSGIPIGSFYFETANETETWITIVPEIRQSKLKLLQLNFAARFPGKSMVAPPVSVKLTAIFNLVFVPLTPLQPVARVSLDGENIDLKPGQLFSLCSMMNADDLCRNDRIEAKIPALTFQRIVKAQQVEGSAMGIFFSLSQEQLDMLRAFAKHIKLFPRSQP